MKSPSAPRTPPAPALPTVATLPSFRQAQPATTSTPSPQNVRASTHDLHTNFAHLVLRFKQLLHVWTGNHAGLSLRRDGIGGTVAILVSLLGRAPQFAIYTPHAVSTHRADATYRLKTWLRAAQPGSTICLRAQEVGKNNHVVRTTENCVAAGARWQHFRLSTKSLASGHKLRFSVYELDALPGDNFEVGGLSAGPSS